jgi:arginyl-tRNA synthetase
MSIFKQLHQEIIAIVKKLFPRQLELGAIVVELPKQGINSDLSTNAAMVLASQLALKPLAIAEEIKLELEQIAIIAQVTIAGSGFINIDLKPCAWHDCLSQILQEKEHFGDCNIGQGARVNVEYVSCNPTGPMHVGHTRGAIFGDVLANILQRCGYHIVREFYINDAGSQIQTLAQSTLLRYQQALGQQITIPQGLYPGEYLISVAEKLVAKYQNSLGQNDLALIKDFATQQMLEVIKQDLTALGICHDVFFSEQTLHVQNKIAAVISKLEQKGYIYKGILPPPKGKVQENWQPLEQLLFKSSQFGDDQDRPLQRDEGQWSYFAAEIAYFEDKIARGFDIMVLILGADHGGYIKRSQAAVKALDARRKCVIKTCQLVNLIKDGQPLKMSKRAGDFITAKDIIDMVGSSVIRFMMLTRKADAVLDFDVGKVVEFSKDNPVFYVQYACVRSLSVINNAAEQFGSKISFDEKVTGAIDMTKLDLAAEIALIKMLALWPKILESSAIFFEPHRIAFYLQSLAADFHSLWNLNIDGTNYRFIVSNDASLTLARVALCKAMHIIIKQGLEIMGVAAMEKM